MTLNNYTNIVSFFYTQDSPVILRDGNGALYPLVKDCLEGIRDPIWPLLPPVQCLGMAVQCLANVGPACKNKVAIIAIAIEVTFDNEDEPIICLLFYCLSSEFDKVIYFNI